MFFFLDVFLLFFFRDAAAVDFLDLDMADIISNVDTILNIIVVAVAFLKYSFCYYFTKST